MGSKSSGGRTEMFFTNFPLTDIRASWGHPWNHTMQVQFVTAGNLRERFLRVLPTGEKHSTT